MFGNELFYFHSQNILAVALLFVTSTSALSESCTSGKIFEMNAWDAVHLTSNCLLESVLDDANSVSEDYGKEFDCRSEELYKIENHQDESSLFIMSCLLQKIRRPGDSLPLSPQVVRERASAAAAEFLEGYSAGDDCTPSKLREVTYLETIIKAHEYSKCMIYQVIRDLSNSEA